MQNERLRLFDQLLLILYPSSEIPKYENKSQSRNDKIALARLIYMVERFSPGSYRPARLMMNWVRFLKWSGSARARAAVSGSFDYLQTEK